MKLRALFAAIIFWPLAFMFYVSGGVYKILALIYFIAGLVYLIKFFK